MNELPIIQKTYDLIKWYIPIINRLPRNHRFTLGGSEALLQADRIINNLYDLLEDLIQARYTSKKNKLARLQAINTQLDILRYQTRLLYDFQLISVKRSEYANKQLNAIGVDLGDGLRMQN